MEQEQLVLLENRNAVLPLSASKLSSVAVIGPQADRVSLGDYVFDGSAQLSIGPLDGIKQYLQSVNSSVQINYAEGCKLWYAFRLYSLSQATRLMIGDEKVERSVGLRRRRRRREELGRRRCLRRHVDARPAAPVDPGRERDDGRAQRPVGPRARRCPARPRQGRRRRRQACRGRVRQRQACRGELDRRAYVSLFMAQ
jgi:hypothetical protein